MTITVYDGVYSTMHDDLQPAFAEAWNWWVDGGYVPESERCDPPPVANLPEAQHLLRLHHAEQARRHGHAETWFCSVEISDPVEDAMFGICLEAAATAKSPSVEAQRLGARVYLGLACPYVEAKRAQTYLDNHLGVGRVVVFRDVDGIDGTCPECMESIAFKQFSEDAIECPGCGTQLTARHDCYYDDATGEGDCWDYLERVEEGSRE